MELNYISFKFPFCPFRYHTVSADLKMPKHKFGMQYIVSEHVKVILSGMIPVNVTEVLSFLLSDDTNF